MRVAALSILFPLIAWCQSPCVFSGRATDELSGAPIGNVRVFAQPARPQEAALWTTTDEQGAFCIAAANPDQYSLVFHRTGYLPVSANPGRTRTDGFWPFIVTPTSTYSMEIAMTPSAVIEGTVFDSEGEPVPGAVVTRYRRFPPPGYSSSDDPARTSTDANGAFRFPNTTAATYRLLAGPPSIFGIRGFGFDSGWTADKQLLETYYSRSLTKDGAVEIPVRAGQTVSGLAITLHKVELRSLQGGVIGATKVLTVLADFRFASGSFMTLSLPVEADGSFRKESLNPGRYSLRVSGAPGFPSKDVDLTYGDVEGVVLGPSLTPPHPNQLELR